MKKPLHWLCCGLVSWFACGEAAFAANGTVDLYPAPADLAEVVGLEKSGVFGLSVNGQDAFVYRGFEVGQGDLAEKGVSYCGFSFTGTVQMTISASDDITSWKIQPRIEDAKQTDPRRIQVDLSEPRKVILTAEMKEKGKQFFIISADAPETNIPNENDPSVIWLKPGVHRFGQAWNPFRDPDKKTLYLAPGAVVEATIKTRDRQGISICGRGLFAQSFVPHAKEAGREEEWDADWLGISIRSCRDVTVEGIAVLNSPSYQLEFADCDNVIARNVKLCGFGERNNDGLHTYSRNVLVEDCFIASNDDRICITGLFDEDAGPDGPDFDGSSKLIGCPVENIMIRNMILYGVERFGGELMLTWNGSDYARRILVENIDCLNATDKGLVSSRHGGSAQIHDMTIRNVRMDHPKLFDVIIKGNRYQGAGGGSIRDVRLEDITIRTDPENIIFQVLGENKDNNIDNITLCNVRANGILITGMDQMKSNSNEFAANIHFAETCRPEESKEPEKVLLAPDPGDLSEIEGLEESKLFDLKVNGQDAFVYRGFEKKDRYGYSQKGVSYCNFSFTGSVEMEISAEKEITKWKIQPPVEGACTVDSKTVRLELSRPAKLILTAELAELGEQYFIISAETPEKIVPRRDDPGVIWLEAGVHRFGQAWNPFKDPARNTLYLAPGAVVQATIKTRDRNTVKILGRGLFSQAFVPHAKDGSQEKEWDADWMGISIRSCKGVQVDGIAVLNSPSYQLEFADCDNVIARNVKLCGFGEHNNDGFHLYSRSVLVEDCLSVGNDDRVCITGLYDADNGTDDLNFDGTHELIDTLVENLVIRDTVFWGLKNGGDIMLTWNGGRQARNILIENCFSAAPTNKGFVSARHGGSVRIYNMIFRSITIDHNRLFEVEVSDPRIQGKGNGDARDFYFENITLAAGAGEVEKQILGKSPQSTASRWTLNNVTAGGRRITDLDQTKIKTNEFVTDIRFQKPHVFITRPFRNEEMNSMETVTLSALPLGFNRLEKCEFYVNGRKIGEDSSDLRTMEWQPDEPGEYTVLVKGIGDSQTVSSSEIQVRVK